MKIERIAFLIPCYNEEESLRTLWTRLSAVADSHSDYEFEFFFVNDGSADQTEAILDELLAELFGYHLSKSSFDMNIY